MSTTPETARPSHLREVWLAGLGAVETVEAEGTTLFEALVERGRKLEAEGVQRIDAVREGIGALGREAVGAAEETARDAAQAVEDTLHEPLALALKRFGVPSRAEIRDLAVSVDALAAKVDRLLAQPIDGAEAPSPGRRAANPRRGR